MTFLERYGNIEDMLKERAEKWIKDIESKGYLFYSKAATKHIDLFKMSEMDMNKEEILAKEKAEKHIDFLKNRVNGEVVLYPVEIMEWEAIKNTEYPSWRD